ncbi:MAG: hypothetical protein KGH57_01195 [Candidatus Micrarchaeota archaeon]|nr:hypothetical protein [Candidatus Micrarchaeota archaeon]
MSFYGLVLVLTVLFISFYLLALMSEANYVSWISAAYARSAQIVQASALTPIKIR